MKPLPRFLARWMPCIGLLLMLLAGLARPAAGQAPYPSDDEVNALAQQIYCPVCENVPLDVCPTEACAQWREVIREKLAQGWTEAQIKEYFVQQYGDRVLAMPPARGLNWLAYLLPPAVILAGAALTVRVLLKARRAPAASDSLPPLDDAYAQQIEEELRRRGGQE